MLQSKLYGSNEDKDVVAHTGIAIIIAATKYDTLHNQDPEVKKVHHEWLCCSTSPLQLTLCCVAKAACVRIIEHDC
jgi:hypothetical protein